MTLICYRVGSSAYDLETVGKPAKQVFSHLVKLGARPLVTARSLTRQTTGGKKSKSLMIGDCEVGEADAVFEKWLNGVVGALEEGDTSKVKKEKKKYNGKNKHQVETDGDCTCKESGEDISGCCSSKTETEEKQKQGNENGSSTDSLSEEEDDEDDGLDIVDLEDMGNIMNEQNLEMKTSEPKEMVTSKQAKV